MPKKITIDREKTVERLIAVVIGIVSLVLGSIIYDKIRSPAPARPKFAYVFGVGGTPLRYGHVSNSVGDKVQLDVDGRFPVPEIWHSASMLYIYDERGNFVGIARLVELENGDFSPLRVQQVAVSE